MDISEWTYWLAIKPPLFFTICPFSNMSIFWAEFGLIRVSDMSKNGPNWPNSALLEMALRYVHLRIGIFFHSYDWYPQTTVIPPILSEPQI